MSMHLCCFLNMAHAQPLFHLQPDIRPSPQAPRGIQVGENDIIVVEGKNKEEEMIENLLGVDLVDDDAVGDAW